MIWVKKKYFWLMEGVAWAGAAVAAHLFIAFCIKLINSWKNERSCCHCAGYVGPATFSFGLVIIHVVGIVPGRTTAQQQNLMGWQTTVLASRYSTQSTFYVSFLSSSSTSSRSPFARHNTMCVTCFIPAPHSPGRYTVQLMFCVFIFYFICSLGRHRV